VRARLARALVHHVATGIDRAYDCHLMQMAEGEREWTRVWVRRERWAFPLARRLDRTAMTDQMVEDGWWG
jgi:hypothetical protein